MGLGRGGLLDEAGPWVLSLARGK